METFRHTHNRLAVAILASMALLSVSCQTVDDDDSSFPPLMNCSDGIDNDGDGLEDYDDPECDCPAEGCTRGAALDNCESQEGFQEEQCDCPEEAHEYWNCAST